MSLSSYLIARSRSVDMVALPVFPSRRLFHTELAFHLDSGVKEPGDLPGKRISLALFYGREYLAMTRDIFGDDLFPYGPKANRPMLEALIEYSLEQGLTSKKMKVEELFAKSTLDL